MTPHRTLIKNLNSLNPAPSHPTGQATAHNFSFGQFRHA